jgi:hypothetical protein
VTDAVGADHESPHAAHDAEDVPFRAGGDAGKASDADVRVDERVERRREVHAFFARGHETLVIALLSRAGHESQTRPCGEEQGHGPGEHEREFDIQDPSDPRSQGRRHTIEPHRA